MGWVAGDSVNFCVLVQLKCSKMTETSALGTISASPSSSWRELLRIVDNFASVSLNIVNLLLFLL